MALARRTTAPAASRWCTPMRCRSSGADGHAQPTVVGTCASEEAGGLQAASAREQGDTPLGQCDRRCCGLARALVAGSREPSFAMTRLHLPTPEVSGSAEGVRRTRRHLLDILFGEGPTWFDGIQVRRVRRQVLELRATRLDAPANSEVPRENREVPPSPAQMAHQAASGRP